MTGRPLKILLLCSAAMLAAGAVKPKVIAHRGGSSSRPENTLAAFQYALKLGVDVLEFDMNVTADDRIVIHHDSTVNPEICAPEPGSTVKAAPIRLLTLSQILQFDCGSSVRAEYPRRVAVPGARMPTLDEFFEAVRGTRALLLGETKMPPAGASYEIQPARFIELVYEIIKKHKVEDRFILQSSDYRAIDEIRKRNPAIRTCLLNARRFKPGYLDLARRHQTTRLMLRTDDVDANGVKALHDAGLQVFSSTANTIADWQKYVELKMDGILTDDPEGLIEFLKK